MQSLSKEFVSIARHIAKPANGFFLYLPDPLTGKLEMFTDLLKCHSRRAVQAIVAQDDVGFPLTFVASLFH